jgi:hypothetical protein
MCVRVGLKHLGEGRIDEAKHTRSSLKTNNTLVQLKA